MTITFSMTGRDLVTRAMQDRRVIAIGEVPEAEELEYGIQTLNLYLKSLGARGVSPWTDVAATAVIPGGTGTVGLNPRPLDVQEARLVQTSTFDRPMQRMEQGEYLAFPNKAQLGEPVMYTVTRTTGTVSLTVWPVPQTDRTVKYTYSRVVEDITADLPLDMPQMWIEAVQKNLAVNMTAFADPPNLMQMMQQAAMLERQLMDFDRPESYFLGPLGA